MVTPSKTLVSSTMTEVFEVAAVATVQPNINIKIVPEKPMKVRVTIVKFYLPIDFVQALLILAKTKFDAERMSVRHGVIKNGQLLRQHFVFAANKFSEQLKDEFERELAELAIEHGIRQYTITYEEMSESERTTMLAEQADEAQSKQTLSN